MPMLKPTALWLTLIFSILVHAEEYVLNATVQFYDANGKALPKVDYPSIQLDIKQWPAGGWFYLESQNPKLLEKLLTKKKIGSVEFVELTTGNNQKVYIPYANLQQGSLIARKDFKYKPAYGSESSSTEAQSLVGCRDCAPDSGNRSFFNRGVRDIKSAQKVVQEPEIKLEGYKSKAPNYQIDEKNDFTAKCSHLIMSDGSLGPTGQALVEDMLSDKASFTKPNSNIHLLCPKFDSLSPKKKFDFNLWVQLALVVKESGCNEKIRSQDKNSNGTCFNAPNRSTNCKQAYGLCQLDQYPHGYGCDDVMKGGMLIAVNNIKCCSRIYRDQNINGNGIIGQPGNHFGPFNNPKHMVFQHFIKQWSDECN